MKDVDAKWELEPSPNSDSRRSLCLNYFCLSYQTVPRCRYRHPIPSCHLPRDFPSQLQYPSRSPRTHRLLDVVMCPAADFSYPLTPPNQVERPSSNPVISSLVTQRLLLLVSASATRTTFPTGLTWRGSTVFTRLSVWISMLTVVLSLNPTETDKRSGRGVNANRDANHL